MFTVKRYSDIWVKNWSKKTKEEQISSLIIYSLNLDNTTIFKIFVQVDKDTCKPIMSQVHNKNTTLILKALTPQNGQTHSNNVSATADELFECVWPFCVLGY